MEPSRADPNSFAAKPSPYPGDPWLNRSLEIKAIFIILWTISYEIYSYLVEWRYTVKDIITVEVICRESWWFGYLNQVGALFRSISKRFHHTTPPNTESYCFRYTEEHILHSPNSSELFDFVLFADLEGNECTCTWKWIWTVIVLVLLKLY